MRIWNATLVAMLVSCGQQPQGAKTEYYIEEATPDDNNNATANNGKKSSGKQTNGTKPGKGDDPDPKALSLTIKDPGAAVSGVIKVEVEIANTSTDATWSAYYSTKEDHSNPVAIDEDMPVSQSSVDWDIGDLEAGSYYLFAELTDGDETKKFSGENPVEIDASGNPTNTRPTLVLDFPQGENVFVAGEAQNIRWTSTDAENDAVSFKVEYSADGGANWTMLAQNLTEKTYSWNVNGLAQGITYRVKVTATDAKGAINTATSQKNFGVATQPMTFAAGFGQLLANRCGNCHATGGPNAGAFRSDRFNDGANNVDVADKMMNIKNRIESANNPMPPADANANDRIGVTLWFWGGNQ